MLLSSRFALVVTNILDLFLTWVHCANNPAGCRRLAECYRVGRGCCKNLTTAVEWYKKGAELGDVWCMCWLARCNEKGMGLKKGVNQHEAFYWYQRSAEMGNYYSMNQLGWHYQFGVGCQKDEKLAFHWYEKAIECKDAPKGRQHPMWDVGYNMRSLGLCYKNGIGCMSDTKKAIQLLDMAAEHGETSSLFSIGLICLQERRYHEAQIYFERCKFLPNDSSAQATFELAHMYEQGTTKEGKDFIQAINLYQEAAEKGCGEAIRALAIAYEWGDIVTKDEDKAFEYYLKALDCPTEDTLKDLIDCFTHGLGPCLPNSAKKKKILFLNQLPISSMEQKCSICFEKAKLVIVPCLHQFHSSCLVKMMLNNQLNCPLCRIDIFTQA